MEKCTLESIYNLIINYYVIGYAINIGHHEYNPKHISRLRLILLKVYCETYELSWDISDMNDNMRKWDDGVIIEKYV